MRFSWGSVALVALLAACGNANLVTTTGPQSGVQDSGEDDAPSVDAGRKDAGKNDAGPRSSTSNLRIMAGNISSGTGSPTYNPPQSQNLIKGLHPDVALLQEMKYGNGTPAAFQEFVTANFGPGFASYREEGFAIPNAVVSRYPIEKAGEWTDAKVNDRSFAYAKINVPNDHVLWAVSVHLLTSSATNRADEATQLVGYLKQVVGPDDFIVVGGDLNTGSRTESAITTFSELLKTTAPFPADQNRNDRTSAPRSKPYDWVLVDPKLAALQVPSVFGTSTYEDGLVFDSRVYTPLGDVAPIAVGDSANDQMQHMPVVKDFAL